MKPIGSKILVAGFLVTVASGVGAADLEAGKAKFAVCAGCHGADGAGNAALGYPKLAGREPVYVAEQLRAFKSGQRQSATMQAMVSGLSETDIDNLAAYVGTLK